MRVNDDDVHVSVQGGTMQNAQRLLEHLGGVGEVQTAIGPYVDPGGRVRLDVVVRYAAEVSRDADVQLRPMANEPGA